MNLASFDLNLLRVLDALLREGSTVRAGERIGLSQPAVSAALGRLRQSLDDPLFVRRGQGLEPTDYARSLALPLRDILREVEGILERRDQFDPLKSQLNFKISGNDFFAEMLMPKLSDTLSSRAPGMRVQLVDLVADSYVATIEKYEVDLALIPQTTLPEWVEAQPVFRSGFRLIAAQGNPRLERAGVKPGDVVPLDLFCDLSHVLFSPEGNTRAMGDAALAKVGRERRVVMTLPVFAGVVSSVSQSDRVALIPAQLATHMSAKRGLSVYQVPFPIPTVLIMMIWHKRSTSNPANRWLRGVIAELLGPLDEV